jgi:hypothetical protein
MYQQLHCHVTGLMLAEFVSNYTVRLVSSFVFSTVISHARNELIKFSLINSFNFYRPTEPATQLQGCAGLRAVCQATGNKQHRAAKHCIEKTGN